MLLISCGSSLRPFPNNLSTYGICIVNSAGHVRMGVSMHQGPHCKQVKTVYPDDVLRHQRVPQQHCGLMVISRFLNISILYPQVFMISIFKCGERSASIICLQLFPCVPSAFHQPLKSTI